MKALVLEEPGLKPRVVVKEIETPRPGPRDVLVEVAACGLCYHDVLVMRGILRRGVKDHVVLGHEIAGVVVEIGSQVTSLSPGDRVASVLTEACGTCHRCRSGREHRCLRGRGIGHTIDGGFAQYVRLHENSLAPLPPALDLEQACILGCPIGVALEAIRDRAGLKAGETTLITGAGGGLGVHGIQVARSCGARVLAVTFSPQKVERLKELGADEVVLAEGDMDFGEVVLALTEERGADMVVNNVGAAIFPSCFTALAQYGRLVLLGDVTGGQVALSPAEVLFKDASIIGSSGTSRAHLLDAARLVSQGRLRPTVSRTYPLDAALEAYEAMLSSESFGRLALKP